MSEKLVSKKDILKGWQNIICVQKYLLALSV